jgi:ATP synthase protein I
MARGPRNHNDTLVRPVRRRQARRAFWERHGERPLAHNLAMIGVLGWLIVLPTLIGTFVGRWLDRVLDPGAVFWTLSLLFAGLCLGCWLAWRRMHEP